MCKGSGEPGNKTRSSGKMGSSELTPSPVSHNFTLATPLSLLSKKRTEADFPQTWESRILRLTRSRSNDKRIAMDMDGKVVVVTGASMGIGEAIAKIFAAQGASVVLLSRDSSRAEAARQRIGHAERTLALACDVRNREDIDRAIAQTVQHFGRVDVWISNAGVGIRDSVAEMAPASYRELFETNFFGALACLQAVVPVMREKGGGAIINISSVAGHIPVPFMAIYSASKFAMNALGKGARVELKQNNINVLTVCPGYVATDFGEHVVADRT